MAAGGYRMVVQVTKTDPLPDRLPHEGQRGHQRCAAVKKAMGRAKGGETFES